MRRLTLRSVSNPPRAPPGATIAPGIRFLTVYGCLPTVYTTMDLKQYRNKLVGSEEERAVSPVIGVILMVAITVILAAVIAAFVLDMGDSVGDTAPSSSFDWDQQDNETVTLEHTGGDPIDTSTLSLTAPNGTAEANGFGGDWDDNEITAGDSIVIPDDTDNLDDLNSSETVQLIWESDGGDSQILTEYEMN